MATDGSAQARKAIELGCKLARLDGGRLGFVHVLLRDIEALTLGSVSNKLSRLAPCDVVMIK